jgi:hypothetical protein
MLYGCDLSCDEKELWLQAWWLSLDDPLAPMD